MKDQIDAIYQQTGVRPLVFYSIVIPEIRHIILQSEASARISSRRWWPRSRAELKLDPTLSPTVPMG